MLYTMKSVYRGYNHHPEIVFIYSTEFQKIDKIRYSLGCLGNVCYVQFTVIVTFANISQGIYVRVTSPENWWTHPDYQYTLQYVFVYCHNIACIRRCFRLNKVWIVRTILTLFYLKYFKYPLVHMVRWKQHIRQIVKSMTL